jgi:hypothetical protein
MFVKNHVSGILWKSGVNIRVSLKSDKNKWCFTWRRTYIYDIFLFLLKMRSVSEKSRTKSKQAFYDENLFSENCTTCDVIWKKYGRDGQATDINIIWRMHITCWIYSATDTHSEYLICFTAAMGTQTHLIVTVYVLCLSCVSTNLYRYQKGFISEVRFFSLTFKRRNVTCFI